MWVLVLLMVWAMELVVLVMAFFVILVAASHKHKGEYSLLTVAYPLIADYVCDRVPAEWQSLKFSTKSSAST